MKERFRRGLRVQLDVLYALVLREMNSRIGRSRVGFFWAWLEPAAHLIVPVVIFSFIKQRVVPGQEYAVFLLYGLLPFLLFKNACTPTMDVAHSSPGVLAYRQVQLMDVFVARLLASTLFECFLMILVLCGLAFFGYDVLPSNPVELLLVLMLSVAMGFGLGLVFAAISSFVPDFRTIVRVAFMFLYVSSGVLFTLQNFSSKALSWLAWNPVLQIVEACRWAGLPNYRLINQFDIYLPIGVALVSLAIGLSLYRLRVVNKVTV